MNNHGVILLVEDNPAVRQLTERVLVRAGYTVLAAAGGHDAAAIAADCENIDLLITDVVMPVMSGQQVASMLREKWSSLPVLFMSGCTKENIEDSGVLREGLHFLEKPFTLGQITTKVAQVVATNGAQAVA